MIISPLREYQKKILAMIAPFNAWALFMKMRTGKTRIAIELIRQRKCKTLVVCPLTVMSVWFNEIAKWAPELKAVNLREKFEAGDIYVINYESVFKLSLPGTLKMIILDESQKIKSVKSKISKFLRAVSQMFEFRLILTGTPAPNSMMEYWPQMNFVEPKVLNPELKEASIFNPMKPNAQGLFYKWRARHFTTYGFGGFLWAIANHERSIIAMKLRERSISMTAEECLDLPQTVDEERIFQLDSKSHKLYKTLEKDFIVKYKGKTLLANNQLTEIMKLRQITSGFFIDENGKNIDIGEQKVEMLDEILDEIGPEQAVIWIQFKHELEKICKLKCTAGKCSFLVGGLGDKMRDRDIENFQRGKSQYMIAHPRSGSLGLDFSNASYQIFFSQSYSLDEYEQACARAIKGGQKNKVAYINIIAEGTIDRIIHKAVMKKEKISDAVLNMLSMGGR